MNDSKLDQREEHEHKTAEHVDLQSCWVRGFDHVITPDEGRHGQHSDGTQCSAGRGGLGPKPEIDPTEDDDKCRGEVVTGQVWCQTPMETEVRKQKYEWS